MTTSTDTIEYELTFLARELPIEIRAVSPVKFRDIYLPDSVEHPHLRIRQKGNSYEITKKMPIRGRDSSEQLEQTIPLEPAEFKALLNVSRKTLEKDRYFVKIDGRAAEVDVFKGDLKGLVLIDFEFGDEKQKAAFQPPDCCLVDVTQEKFVAGGLLAGKTYSDIESDLKKLNYHKIL